jgi:hypothetical protein
MLHFFFYIFYLKKLLNKNWSPTLLEIDDNRVVDRFIYDKIDNSELNTQQNIDFFTLLSIKIE